MFLALEWPFTCSAGLPSSGEPCKTGCVLSHVGLYSSCGVVYVISDSGNDFEVVSQFCSIYIDRGLFNDAVSNAGALLREIWTNSFNVNWRTWTVGLCEDTIWPICATQEMQECFPTRAENRHEECSVPRMPTLFMRLSTDHRSVYTVSTRSIKCTGYTLRTNYEETSQRRRPNISLLGVVTRSSR
jgi:hypothetical protein